MIPGGRPGPTPHFWRGVASALVVKLFLGAVFAAGAWWGWKRPRPAPAPPDHHVFYYGRPHTFVGDDKTEVEVFKDGDGTWVALVWERGRCWSGKLTKRLR